MQDGKGSLGESMRKKKIDEKCFDSIDGSILIQLRFTVINNCPDNFNLQCYILLMYSTDSIDLEEICDFN